MDKRRFIWAVLLVALLLPAACKREVVRQDEEQQPELGVFISIPGSDDTKAETGEVEGLDFERNIFSLKLWVFESESGTLVCYHAPSSEQLPRPGRTKFYSLSVSGEFARLMPDVDVFVLANAASVNCTLDKSASRDQVRDAVFGGEYFSTVNPVRYVSAQGGSPAVIDSRLTDLGLPMSGARLGVTVEGENPVLRIPTITLQRAVSKLRFVFCKMASEVPDNIIITGVSLSGDLIPMSEKVFCPSPAKYAIDGSDYLEDVMTIDTHLLPLASSEGPEKFVYAGQDASAYERLLQTGIAAGELTDFGTTYLRESDKRLTGYVSYLINPEEGDQPKVMPFEMDLDGFDHDFARNHTWTLYGYFLSGRYLQLSVRALPWDYNVNQVDFEDAAVSVDQLSLLDDGNIEVVELGKNAQGGDDYNVFIKPGGKARGSIIIHAPKTGTLFIRAIGDVDAIEVTPEMAEIFKDNNPVINFAVGQRADAEGDVRGKSVTLSFSVELGTREVSANTEIFNNDRMTFILK